MCCADVHLQANKNRKLQQTLGRKHFPANVFAVLNTELIYSQTIEKTNMGVGSKLMFIHCRQKVLNKHVYIKYQC